MKRVGSWFAQQLQQFRMNREKCGCGGELDKNGYCQKHWGSPLWDMDSDIQGSLRTGGLGFATHLSTGGAAMSMHRQEYGADPDAVTL